MEPFAVSATSHWPNYLPEYVAADLGYFADEGLDFTRWAPDNWTDVLEDVDTNRADVVLGGIWVPAMYHGRGREHRAFAALNARNPKAIMTRTANPGFTPADLAGRTVLAGTGLWADVRIDRDSYDEWAAMIAEEGLTDAPVAYDDLVDQRPAEYAAAQLASAF